MNRISVTVLWLLCCCVQVQGEPLPMPSLESVGPGAMSASIAEVSPPFDMRVPTRPEFARRSVDITKCGATPGSSTPATETIQHCIEKLTAAGGGTVVIPAGKWLTGRIELKSGVNLHLSEGAELHFSGEIADYLPAVPCRYEGLDIMGLGGLIFARGQQGIGLTGRGELVGPADGPVRELRRGLTDNLIDTDVPLAQRLFDGQDGRHFFRPYFVCLMECKDVLIEGVSLHNGPMWNVVPILCDGVLIRGVQIDSRGVVNGDGVNIESSRNVLVEYCHVITGDDCFTLKAGRGIEGVRAARPVENVVLRHNLATGGYGGVTCGSETAGGIRDIYVRDCIFNDVRHAVYFKTRRPRGGGGERFTAERIKFRSYEHGLFFDMLGSTMFVGELANRLPALAMTELTPYYRDITLRRIEGHSGGDAFKIKGIPESPATRVSLAQVQIDAKGLLNLADVKEVNISDCTFHSETKTLRLVNAKGVRCQNVQFDSDDATVFLDATETGADGLVIESCSPQLTQQHD